MGVLDSIYQRLVKYNTKRKILKVLGDIKQFSKDQREKAVQLIMAVHGKADGMLESIVKKEYPPEIRQPLEKDYILVCENGKYVLGRYASDKISSYQKSRVIAYAPFMRTF